MVRIDSSFRKYGATLSENDIAYQGEPLIGFLRRKARLTQI